MLIITSCSKEDKLQPDKKVADETEAIDTNLTPEEKFSSSVLVDFLNDSDDDDLASFLETQVYKLGANYTGTAVIEATPSTWLVVLEKNGTTKNYLLQKYVDFKSNDYYFSFNETSLTTEDIISKSKNKTSAGQ